MTGAFGDGIPIPDVIDPPDSMEMTLCIPRNRDHMAAFFGALYELTVWNSWQQDGTEHGKELAAVWWRYYLSWDRQMSDIDCENGMSKCCVPNVETKRINPDTGRAEISFDGGVTWQPDPNDVQNQVQVIEPIVRTGSPKTKCDAATNASEHINELITATSNNLDTAGTIFELVVAIAEAALALVVVLIVGVTIPPAAIALATAIWAAGAAAFELGKTGFDAYWTTDKKDAILCFLFCNIGENGQFTEAQYQAFRAKMKSTLPASPAFDIVMTTINATGAAGLSNMASYGNAATADCDSCSCDDSDCLDHSHVHVYNGIDFAWTGDCTFDITGELVGSDYTWLVYVDNDCDDTTVTYWNATSAGLGTLYQNDACGAGHRLANLTTPSAQLESHVSEQNVFHVEIRNTSIL